MKNITCTGEKIAFSRGMQGFLTVIINCTVDVSCKAKPISQFGRQIDNFHFMQPI